MRKEARIRKSESLLWKYWGKTCHRNGRCVVLIETEGERAWTAEVLRGEIDAMLAAMPEFKPGSRIGFCLPNGAVWMTLFLALQKRGLTAAPLDAGLPEAACLELARHVQCSALFFQGKWHELGEFARERSGIACIKVTSGTAGGLPNLVRCRAEHLIADGTNIIKTMGIRPGDRNLAVIPLGHSYGLGNFVLPLILQGTPIVCAGRFVPHQLAEWMGRYGVTVFPSVPAIFRVLASMSGTSALGPLRLAISAGAPLTAEVAQSFYVRYRVKIHNFYGSSETGGICYDRRGEATLSGRSVGKPLAGVEVTVMRGAIRVKSGAVAKPGGRWRVPDLGEWTAKGELVLVGRVGREVNLGGKKVHPAEVEQALRALPGVSDAMVWGAVAGARTLLQAAVETRLSLGEVQWALAAKLPEWKLPKRYVVMPEFPRSARGKVDVKALRGT